MPKVLSSSVSWQRVRARARAQVGSLGHMLLSVEETRERR